MRRMAALSARLVERRTVLKTGFAWGAIEVAFPFTMRARGEQLVKIGMVEPLSGVYSKLAEAEVAGARLAVEEVNQSGGILGREAQLLVEDSANDIAVGIAKTRQLIDAQQVDFILGNVNSAVALAMMRVTAEKRKLHIVTGAHTDEITGSNCSWNVFRICKTTTMEANAIADTLIDKFGNKWYFLTPDYVYGYALQAAFERKLRDHGGTWAGDVLPLGTVDFSRPLLNAGAYRPNVLINLMGGKDQTNSLQQIVRFGICRIWRLVARCSSLKVSSAWPTRPKSAGGRWNGGGISRTCHRSWHLTKRSGAVPTGRQARATGLATSPFTRSPELPIKRNPLTRSRSPAHCKATPCRPK